MATSIEGSKYCHSSTKPDNLAKIGPVDFEIIGETGIVKNKYYKWETEAEHRARRPDFSSRAGEIKFTRTITAEGCRSPIIYVDMAIVKSRLFGKDQWGHQDQSIGAWGSGKEEVNNPSLTRRLRFTSVDMQVYIITSTVPATRELITTVRSGRWPHTLTVQPPNRVSIASHRKKNNRRQSQDRAMTARGWLGQIEIRVAHGRRKHPKAGWSR